MKRDRILAVALAGALWALAMDANATDIMPTHLGVHVTSRHLDRAPKHERSLGWHDANVGLYARWGALTAGGFTNSIRRPSFYVGYTFADAADVFAVTVGVITGYERQTRDGRGTLAARCLKSQCRDVYVEGAIYPMVVPSVRIPLVGATSARLSVLKAPGAPAAVHLSLEYRL